MISTISKQVQSDWKGIKITECENSNEKLSLIYDEMITKLNITDGKKNQTLFYIDLHATDMKLTD